MSDMEIRKPGVFHRVGDFIKREITGEEKEGEKEGTWSNSTLDYVTKGGVTGGLLGAGMGAVAHYAGGDKSMTYKYEVPIMEKKEIGQIPQNHVAADKVMGDPRFVRPDGKPVDGMGAKVYGEVPKKGLLGGIQMEEKTAEAASKGHSLFASVLGGALIGTLAGVLAGVALKLINGVIHPEKNSQAWSRSAPQPWNNAAPPAWKNSSTPGAWSQSAPSWSNTHNKAPWSNTHSNYHDTHSNYHDTHSNYHDIHSNYSNSHSNYSNSHSNYSNSHSNSWDRNISY